MHNRYNIGSGPGMEYIGYLHASVISWNLEPPT